MRPDGIDMLMENAAWGGRIEVFYVLYLCIVLWLNAWRVA